MNLYTVGIPHRKVFKGNRRSKKFKLPHMPDPHRAVSVYCYFRGVLKEWQWHREGQFVTFIAPPPKGSEITVYYET